MSRKSWNEFYVKCPYFQRDDGRRTIECEGIVHRAKNITRFPDETSYRIQLQYCMGCYRYCEIYRMLNGIYDMEE